MAIIYYILITNPLIFSIFSIAAFSSSRLWIPRLATRNELISYLCTENGTHLN